MAMKVGLRVKVFSGAEREYLGLGTIVGVEKIQVGRDIVSIPVIKLDSGEVLRGYECWWIPRREADMVEKEHAGRIIYE